ncbi:hypothetical protein DPMN_065627 [Dreissena polymorpha]|uniref:Uncharacterized protein n=1 Tax=Dreissena polymorpha TaxID=45954 RepID=A0A9D3YWU1_DREPO|nr:hypothetical protein DPMN_065627 [Dreissena polymorpha]
MDFVWDFIVSESAVAPTMYKYAIKPPTTFTDTSYPVDGRVFAAVCIPTPLLLQLFLLECDFICLQL